MDFASAASPSAAVRYRVIARIAIIAVAVAALLLALIDAFSSVEVVDRGPAAVTRDPLAAGVAGALLLATALCAAVAWFDADPVESAMAFWFVSLVPLLGLVAGFADPWFDAIGGEGARRLIGAALVIGHVVAHLHLFRACFGDEAAEPGLRRLIERAVPVAALIVPVLWMLPPAGQFAVAGLAALGALVRIARVSWPSLRDGGRLDQRAYLLALLAQALCGFVQAFAPAASDPSGWRLLSFWNGSAVFVAVGTLMVVERRRHHGERRARLHREAVDAARQYRHVYYSAPVGLVSATASGHVLRWNDMAQRFFPDRLQPGRFNTLAGVFGEERAAALVEGLDGGRPQRGELRRAGTVLAYEAVVAGGAIEMSFVDVSERSRLAEALERIAHHDSLTDLLNRRGLEVRIDEALRERGPRGDRVSLIYVNLDHFKGINEVFGHEAGDAVIVEVAHRMQHALGAQTRIGRLGGDEFIALLTGVPLAEARRSAAVLLDAVSGEPFEHDGQRFDVQASIGVVEASAGMQTRELIAQADDACTRAKRAGPRRIAVMRASDLRLDDYRASVRLGSKLKSCLPIERMRVYAQPIVALREAEPVPRYEVLLREVDEQGRIEPPDRLLAAAERQGSMAAIDRHVLQSTIEHLCAHPEHTRSLGFVTVNVSGMSLNDDRFHDDAVAMLRDHRLAASRIVLEITESVAVRDMSGTRRFVERMRDIGVGIALDDFGAGYTSFAYLRDIPASLLKIDGQFIVDLAGDRKLRGIVRAIQQLGAELGMACLAEWVEDVPTLEALLELRVDYAQGYVFSRALPLESWLTTPTDLAPLHAARQALRSTGKVIA
ncbi:MAG: EAL domain-containing protein [Burkholderiaceae bacterium]